VEGYFGDGSRSGARMHFNRETELMGTAGGVKRVAEMGFFNGGDTFLIIGGDDLTDIDLTAMLRFHKERRALATIALSEVDDPSQFGVVVLDDGGAIHRFVEKPPAGTAPRHHVNMGVYLFEPAILDLIPDGEFYDFGKQLFPLLLEQQQPFFGYRTNCYWRDVGNLKEYRDCHDDYFAGTVELGTDVPRRSEGLWLGEECRIDPTAIIEPPAMLGRGCVVEAGARVTDRSVLAEGCVVGRDAVVSHSILWTGARVEPGTEVVRCIIGEGSQVASNVGVFDASIVPSGRAEE